MNAFKHSRFVCTLKSLALTHRHGPELTVGKWFSDKLSSSVTINSVENLTFLMGSWEYKKNLSLLLLQVNDCGVKPLQHKHKEQNQVLFQQEMLSLLIK